jgi:hypothetical protein
MIPCRSCGGREADGCKFSHRPGLPKMCEDCLVERPSTFHRGSPPRTRASYRAAFRHRQKSDQLDLVDQLVPPP